MVSFLVALPLIFSAPHTQDLNFPEVKKRALEADGNSRAISIRNSLLLLGLLIPRVEREGHLFSLLL